MSIHTPFAALATLALLSFAACTPDADTDATPTCISGEGAAVTEAIVVEGEFTRVRSTADLEVRVTDAPSAGVTVTGAPNLVPAVLATVSDGTLTIALAGGCYETDDVVVEVTAATLASATNEGAGTMTVVDVNRQVVFAIATIGAGDLHLVDISRAAQLNVEHAGSGQVLAERVEGLEALVVDASGAGDCALFGAPANVVRVEASGAGDVEVTAMRELEVALSGTGDVRYRGPAEVTQAVTGTGRVVDAND